MKIFALITLLLLISSCSKKAAQTSADFKLILSGISGLTSSDGGAMLWGKASSGASFSVNLNSISGDLVLELKNDTWDFYAITWAGVGGEKLTGVTSCATSKGNVLSGGEVSVDLNLSNSNCVASDFTPTHRVESSNIMFPKLNITSCENFNSITGSVPCSPDPANVNRGYYRSYRVIYPEFSDNAGDFTPGNNSLTSTCIEKASGSGNESHMRNEDLNIPIGSSNTPFRTIIRGYAKTGCDDSYGFIDDVYEDGVFSYDHATAGIIKGNLRVHSYDISSVQHIILHHLVTSDVFCNLSTAPAGEFPTGDGSISYPYGICSPEQFNSVGDDSTLLTKNFELLRDLDFGGYSTALNTPYGSPHCANIGTSLIPFGGLDSDLGCGTPITSPTSFSGIFNGNKYSIKNAFLIEEDLSYLGLFRKLEGEVSNLNIENIEIEGSSYVGAITGQTIGTGAITNILAHKGNISSRESASAGYTGGLIGELGTSFTFNSSHALRFAVEARGDYIGGLVGASSSGITSSSFVGSITTENQGSTISYVGGLSGKQLSGDIIDSKSNGAIVVNGTKIGGLTGYLSASYSVDNSYSLMSILNNNIADAQSTGGLIGQAAGSNTIQNSYFAGGIKTLCASFTIGCEVAKLVGTDAGSSIPDSFSAFGSSSYGGLDGTEISYSDFESITFSSSNAPSWPWGVNWQTQQEGSLPRLSWETPEIEHCIAPINYDSISNQITAGRGTASSPIEICSPTQFRDLKNHSYRSFVLSNNINLREFTDSDISSSFTNNLDGNEYVLHGLFLSSGSTNNYGLINTIETTGSIENLNIIDFDVESFSGINVSNLTAINHGLINNVKIISSKLTGGSNVGGFAGNNTGTIKNSTYNYGHAVTGDDSIGGIAGKNSGLISKSISNSFFPINAATNNLGSIVGNNETTGIISEVSSSSTIQIDAEAYYIGGIVGYNQGLIEDVKNSEYSTININYTPSSRIGGIAGENETSGVIRNAIHLGRLPASILSSLVGPIVGDNNASPGELIDNFYFNRPYLNTSLEAVSIVGAAVGSINECIVELSGGPASTFVNDFVTFSSGSAQYEILALDTTPDRVTIQASSDACSTINSQLSNMEKFDFSTGNQLGTYVSPIDLMDIATYCSDSIPVSDPDFRCENGWDITIDDIGGNGFNHLKEIFKAQIFRESPPTTSPKWVIEDGRYPNLLFNW